jgi:hypothetical protein
VLPLCLSPCGEGGEPEASETAAHRARKRQWKSILVRSDGEGVARDTAGDW